MKAEQIRNTSEQLCFRLTDNKIKLLKQFGTLELFRVQERKSNTWVTVR